MKKIIKNNLLGFILGVIFTSCIGVAASTIWATDITYTKKDNTKVTVQKAIDDLYKMAGSNTGNNSQSGKTVITSDLPTGVVAIVYLDPTDLSNNCDSSNAVSTTGTKTGCMKWYAYKEDSTTYTMILDHNTTAIVPYNTSGSSASMGTTSGNVGYDLAQLTATSKWVVGPRLISSQEVAAIVGKTEFNALTTISYYLDSKDQTQTANATNKSTYAWLFDYTKECINKGCNIEDDSTCGYWTSTPRLSDDVRNVNCNGKNGYTYANDKENKGIGLRPVITITK